MASEPKVELTELQKSIFDKIAKNEFLELRAALAQLKSSVDFTDENGMTPLCHASYKGSKDAVQLLLDQVNWTIF
jgi:ankyrin repeat and MYND domain-containing protein 2